MASAEFDEKSDEKRPTVQVGDPFTEKLLLEACLELFDTDALVGIQDMGAAGLTSSSIEMAGRAGSGIELDVAKVPRRETGMTPYEVMLSESQERMVLVAKAGRESEVLAIFHKWDLDAAVIGRVTGTGHVVVKDAGQTVADLPVKPLTDGAPGVRPAAQAPRRPRRVAGVRPARRARAEGPRGRAARCCCRAPPSRARSGCFASTTTRCAWAACCCPARATRRWCGWSAARRAWR